MYLQYREEQDAKESERKRSEVRQNIIANFETIANDIARKMNESFNKWLNENAATIVEKFN